MHRLTLVMRLLPLACVALATHMLTNAAARAAAPLGPISVRPAVSAALRPPSTAVLHTLSFVSGASQARYRVRESVYGSEQVHDVLGTASGVSGAVHLDADGAVVRDQSRVTVDLTTLHTDQPVRDEIVRTTTLETETYRWSEFVPTSIEGMEVWPADGDAHFTLCGDLTLHGVMRQVCLAVNGHFSAERVSGTASGAISLLDFGVNPPQLGQFAVIQDLVDVDLDFSADLNVAAALF